MTESYVALAAPLLMVIALSALVVSVTRGAAEGRIARNGSIGIRTSSTQAYGQAWTAGHAAALPSVRRTWWVALAAVPASLAGQAVFGGDIGVGVAIAALLLETVVLLQAGKVATAAARNSGLP
ncbi:hypothetical protein [Arthrobacter ginkgonis]